MISAKETLIGLIKSKQELKGVLNKSIEYVNPITQEKEVTPSKEVQEVVPDTGYTGLSKVIVKEISDDYENINEYFDNVISSGSYNTPGFVKSIKKLPNLIFNGTSCEYMFKDSFFTEIPLIDISNATLMSFMFYGCGKLIQVPNLNTSNNTRLYNTFNECRELVTIPLLNTEKTTDLENCFRVCYKLTNLGGLENLGMAYDTTKTANDGKYKLDLSYSSKLTHDSLMNIINNLYDIKNKGCNVQQVVLGSTNLAKLTSEEIAIATNKGWTVS